MKRVLMILITFMFSMTSSWSQETWLRTFGGTNRDYGQSLSATPDGGYVLTGTTGSDDGDFEGSSRGAGDVFVMRLDSRGDLVWKKTFGGSGKEAGQSITTTPDGGYVLTGTTASDDGDFEGMNKGWYDIFVIKLGSRGELQWKKTFGGAGNELGHCIVNTLDGGYVLTGLYSSTNGDFEGMKRGYYDIFVVKLDSGGDVQWKKTFGGSGNDRGWSISLAPDGGCVVTGDFRSNDGDFEGMNRGNSDIFVIKLGSRGDLQWKKTLGGVHAETSYAITTTPDGDCIGTGETISNSGDFMGVRREYADIFVTKLGPGGDVKQKMVFEGSAPELGRSIAVTPDGGCVLTGSSKVGVYPAEYDIFIIKLDSGGDVQWQKTFGGSDDDISYSITVSLDGGCVITGETNSRDGDFESVNRVWLRTDIFIIKLNAQGHLQWKRTFGGAGSNRGNCIATTHDGGYVLTGESLSKDGEFVGMNKGGFDIFVLKLDAHGNLNIPTSVNDQTDNSSPLTVSPNPFSSVSNVSYSLDQPSHVRIEVVNSIGEVTAVLSDRQAEIGAHEVSLNATHLGTGTYWIRMVTDHQVFSKQVVLIR